MFSGSQPVQILTELSNQQSSGILKVTQGAAVWLLILENGKLKQAISSVQSLSQLDYHLRRMGHEAAVAAVKTFPEQENATFSEEQGLYDRVIPWLTTHGLLNLEQGTQLIKDITRDALETFLWLQEGIYQWFEGAAAPSVLSQGIEAADIPTLVQSMLQRLDGWQHCSPAINSPHQRPYIGDYRLIQQPIDSGTLKPSDLERLSKLMRGISIRQLALLLKQDELKIAQILCPYIKGRVIFLREPNPPLDQLPTIPTPSEPEVIGEAEDSGSKIFKIACIDDSPTILEEMNRFLGNERFQVTTINDPIQAASIIFRLKPDLILMDITMPEISGYKLCGLLRNSAAFETTPIIMVTGNTGLIDKARAKLVGATDYLTKPFTNEQLTMVVERYLEQTNED
jgi:two-component system, chemotaxis family, response regulator PixG